MSQPRNNPGVFSYILFLEAFSKINQNTRQGEGRLTFSFIGHCAGPGRASDELDQASFYK